MKLQDHQGADGQLAEQSGLDGESLLPSWDGSEETAAQHCERCSGLLYWTELREWDGSRGQGDHGALQCIICGNIIDPVIVKNRQRSLTSVRESVATSARRWRRMLSAAVVGEPIGRGR
jgi:hypothetical protein